MSVRYRLNLFCAIDRKLVDELSTSDEYLARACDDKDVFEVRWVEHKKPIERLMGQLNATADRIMQSLGGTLK